MVFFQIMMSLADSGHTILCTLHQPGSALYAQFDRLYLMADGYTIYNGKAKDAIGYFASAGHECPAYVNPSDFFLDMLTCFGLTPEEAVKRKMALKDFYLEHEGIQAVYPS
jgi:ABC-type multidrug transport system ATPase subunit